MILNGSTVHRNLMEKSCDDDIDNISITYGTCLRSCLVILRCASEQQNEEQQNDTCNHSNSEEEPQSMMFDTQSTFEGSIDCCHQRSRHQLVIKAQWLAYGFEEIDKTYMQYIHRVHIDKWIRRNFHKIRSIVPSKSWIAQILSRQQKGNCRRLRRSPYAEFFDHPYTLSNFIRDDDDDNAPDSNKCRCGCLLSVEDRHNHNCNYSCLVDLNKIRSASQKFFTKAILERLSSDSESSSSSIRTGWTGTIQAKPGDLIRMDDENGKNLQDEEQDNLDYFVGGVVAEMHSVSNFVASISDDDTCQIPVNFLNQENVNADINDFVVGEIDSVIISCLCIGSATTELNDQNDENVSEQKKSIASTVSLPSLGSTKNGRLSGCFLIVIQDMIFIAAVQIQCRDLHVSKPRSSSDGEKATTTLLSVEKCLMETEEITVMSTHTTIKGLLNRRRFHMKMTSDGSHKGCLLSLSSLPRKESIDLESDNSCLQIIEVSVLFPQNTARLLKFIEKLNYLWSGANLSDAQKLLGSSFWALGDSGRTCALTFGGFEDRTWSSSSDLCVCVHFPSSSVQKSKLGYVRSSCNYEEIDAIAKKYPVTQFRGKFMSDGTSSPIFDFEGCTKVPKGRLLHRIHRRHILFGSVDGSNRTVGEISTTPSSAIPLCTLSGLFQLIFQHLQKPGQAPLNPSLVWRVSSAHFLGVSFCQAQCYCMKCCCALLDPRQNVSRKNGVRSAFNDIDEVSFWHLPHPNEDPFGNQYFNKSNNQCNEPPHIRESTVSCPNNCPIGFFGVKWECSGMIDDGSGQATLYADGDAALTLLGMSADDIRWIEEAIWSVPGGRLIFKKSVPPSRELRDVVGKIIAKNSNVADPIKLLPIRFRGEHILETHCRSSNRPKRPLDYYVRCKPLSENARYLNHTAIDSFFSEDISHEGDSIFQGEVATYTLPPLKLELVDCGQPSFEIPGQDLLIR